MNQPRQQLPYSESSERNKQAIFDVLEPLLANADLLLEIGSGTGQHAVWMAGQACGITWQPSELADHLTSLKLRLDLEAPANVRLALTIDVAENGWCDNDPDIIYTCNTFHIMSNRHVEAFWKHAGELLKPSAYVVVYGPFKYSGEFTTPSNAKFDLWLKQRDPDSGVRDFEKVNELATNNNFGFIADHAMPANNQCIVWQKIC